MSVEAAVTDGFRAWVHEVLIAVITLFMVLIQPLLRYILFCVQTWQSGNTLKALFVSSPVIIAALLVVALHIRDGVQWWSNRKK